MGKIYDEAIKVNIYGNLLNRFFDIIVKSPFIEVGDGYSKNGQYLELTFTEFGLNEKKIQIQTIELFVDIRNFILNTISNLSYKETYLFLVKALSDFDLYYTNETDVLLKDFNDYYTIPNEEGGYNYWPFINHLEEDIEFKKKIYEKFSDISMNYIIAGKRIHSIIKELYRQLLKGHLILDTKLGEIENQEKLNKTIKKNQLELLEYVFEEHRPIFVLHDGFDLSSLNSNGQVKLSKLELKQTIILFELLMQKGLFVEFDKTSIMNLLTGGSKKNLNTLLGQSKKEILNGKKTIRKRKISYEEFDTKDLQKVYDLLESIVCELKEKVDKAK